MKSSSHLHTLGTLEDIKDLPLVKIRQIHGQLSRDLEKLSQVSNLRIPFISSGMRLAANEDRGSRLTR